MVIAASESCDVLSQPTHSSLRGTPSLSKVPLIAIVDNDPAMREALRDLLQVAGLSSRIYAGAAAFFDEHAPGRFALVLTDLRMPGTDGIELLRRLRSTGDDLPAIVVTSASDPVTQAQAIDEGALACLPKPVADHILLDLIATVLERDGKRPPGD
jgi:FixJ family two-component response regulator